MGVRQMLHKLRRSGQVGVGLLLASTGAAVALATGFMDPLSLLITVGGAIGATGATYSRARLVSARRQMAAAPEGETHPQDPATAPKPPGRPPPAAGAP